MIALNVDNIVTVITRPDALTDAQWQGARERLAAQGFKILLDILANLPAGAPVGEVGYVFRPRLHGRSKLGVRATWHFFSSLCGLAAMRAARACQKV